MQVGGGGAGSLDVPVAAPTRGSQIVTYVTSGDGRWRVGLGGGPLSVGDAADWVTHPGCGAVVTFTGTTRDHSDGDHGTSRTGVTVLDYEAYDTAALDRLGQVAQAVTHRWPTVARVHLAHRTGPVALGEASVVVAVSAPHRPEAFDAARFAIDQLKATVPVWKRETHDAGAGWATGATPITNVDHPRVDPPVFDTCASMADTGGVSTPGWLGQDVSGESSSEDHGWET
jgi:molybdopterin synthase catalytic subunit